MNFSTIMTLGQAMNQIEATGFISDSVSIEYWSPYGIEALHRESEINEIQSEIEMNLPLCSMTIWF